MGVSIDAARDDQTIEQGSAAEGPGVGPKTQEGKGAVRRNATRHGISAPAPVVLSLEKSEDWEEHRGGVLQDLSPVGHLEATLAERTAVLSWRSHRVARYETAAISLTQRKGGVRMPNEPPVRRYTTPLFLSCGSRRPPALCYAPQPSPTS
jgi:hypothetical protein